MTFRLLQCVFILLLLSACAGRNAPAPVGDVKPGVTSSKTVRTIVDDVYIVKPGETLYSIAWRADMDVAFLAKINLIDPPFKIFVGQSLYLDEKQAKSAIARRSKIADRVVKNSAGATSGVRVKKDIAPSKKQEYGDSKGKEKLTKIQVSPPKNFSKKVANWKWPVKGKIVKYFSTKPDGSKGIDIAGKRGDPVKSTAAGKVVYAGSALSGYGKLIIIKHNDDYLSAYAHNDKILVKEQQTIKAGQLIAKMGDTDAERVMLHFEIRFRGKTVNPLKYLPRK